MNQDKTDEQEKLREAARIAMLAREAEIRRRTAESMKLRPDIPTIDLIKTKDILT